MPRRGTPMGKKGRKVECRTHGSDHRFQGSPHSSPPLHLVWGRIVHCPSLHGLPALDMGLLILPLCTTASIHATVSSGIRTLTCFLQ